jgi:hypothetical protein
MVPFFQNTEKLPKTALHFPHGRRDLLLGHVGVKINFIEIISMMVSIFSHSLKI